MTKDEALKLALEALNDLATWNDGEVGSHMDEPYAAEVARRTIIAIKEALAQPEPEYLVFMDTPQRTWVGLELSEIEQIILRVESMDDPLFWMASKVEAKLKEKNVPKD